MTVRTNRGIIGFLSTTSTTMAISSIGRCLSFLAKASLPIEILELIILADIKENTSVKINIARSASGVAVATPGPLKISASRSPPLVAADGGQR